MKAKNRTFGFTLIEIMVAIAVLALLATIAISFVGSLDTKSKITKTQAQIKLLAEAVTAFKNANNYFPLAVPEDAWGRNWNDDTHADEYINVMEWRSHWRNFFRDDDNNPQFTWDGNNDVTKNPIPSNIHVLAFQLEQNPESRKIFEQIKSNYSVKTPKAFKPNGANEKWQTFNDVNCRLAHPLDPAPNPANPDTYRQVYQVQDAWGTPLRFWTRNTLDWAKKQGWDGSPDTGNQIQQLLSKKLQEANWGFFIESAGKDGKFGWWGNSTATYTAQAVEDNIYSTTK